MQANYQGLFGPIAVREEGGVRRLYIGEMYQGGMLVGAPHAWIGRVFGAFHFIAALRPVPERVLIIGLGAGEVPRSFWHAYRGTTIRVAEIDPVVVEVAREHFELPEGDRLQVIVADGAEVLRAEKQVYDLIILDANAGEAGLPPQFGGQEFLELAKARLTPEGMLAVNLLGAREGPLAQSAQAFAVEAGRLFPERYRLTSLTAAPEQLQNVVLFLGSRRPLPADGLRAPAGFRVETDE